MKRIVLILSALALTSCETLTPQERAALFNLGARVVESRLLPTNQK